MGVKEKVALVKEFVIKNTTVCIASAIGVILTVMVCFAVGFNMGIGQTVDKDMLKAKQQSDETYTSQQAEIAEQEKTIEENSAVIAEIESYKEKKASLDQSLADAEAKVTELNSQAASLDGQITSKKSELDTLTGNILKAQGTPKTLSSGDYIVGTDLPSGRYIVSGSSNFQVYTSSGDIFINTILGNSAVGRGDYTALLNDGMIMHCAAKTKFTPVS